MLETEIKEINKPKERIPKEVAEIIQKPKKEVKEREPLTVQPLGKNIFKLEKFNQGCPLWIRIGSANPPQQLNKKNRQLQRYWNPGKGILDLSYFAREDPIDIQFSAGSDICVVTLEQKNEGKNTKIGTMPTAKVIVEPPVEEANISNDENSSVGSSPSDQDLLEPEENLIQKKVLEAEQKNLEAGLWCLLSENSELGTVTQIGKDTNITFLQKDLKELEIGVVPVITVSEKNFKIAFSHEEKTVSLEILNEDLKKEIQKIVINFEKKEEKENGFDGWVEKFQESDIWEQIVDTSITFNERLDYFEKMEIDPYQPIHTLKYPTGLKILEKAIKPLEKFDIQVEVSSSEEEGANRKTTFSIVFKAKNIPSAVGYTIKTILNKASKRTSFKHEGKKIPPEIRRELERISKTILEYLATKRDKSKGFLILQENLKDAETFNAKAKDRAEIEERKLTNIVKLTIPHFEERKGRFANIDAYKQVESLDKNHSREDLLQAEKAGTKTIDDIQVLLRDSVPIKSKVKTDGEIHYSKRAYEKTNKLLCTRRNEKRFIARILATLYTNYNTAPPLLDPKMHPIIKKAFDRLKISQDLLVKDEKKISPGDLIGKIDPESKTEESWTEIIMNEFQEQGIALPHPQPAIIMKGSEFLKKARAISGSEKWDPLS